MGEWGGHQSQACRFYASLRAFVLAVSLLGIPSPSDPFFRPYFCPTLRSHPAPSLLSFHLLWGSYFCPNIGTLYHILACLSIHLCLHVVHQYLLSACSAPGSEDSVMNVADKNPCSECSLYSGGEIVRWLSEGNMWSVR